MVRNWNSRVKVGDTVVTVGDWCCHGAERGIPGSKTKSQSWEALLNGKVIHVLGNHDRNNGTKAGFDLATVCLAGHACVVRHRPIKDGDDACRMPEGYNIMIHGHVHTAWRIKWIEGFLHINVGVDVNKYAPVRQDELIRIIERELKKGPP